MSTNSSSYYSENSGSGGLFFIYSSIYSNYNTTTYYSHKMNNVSKLTSEGHITINIRNAYVTNGTSTVRQGMSTKTTTVKVTKYTTHSRHYSTISEYYNFSFIQSSKTEILNIATYYHYTLYTQITLQSSYYW